MRNPAFEFTCTPYHTGRASRVALVSRIAVDEKTLYVTYFQRLTRATPWNTRFRFWVSDEQP